MPADLQHAIMDRVLGGKLTTAPITNPQRVLDIGTGTGIWAVEFGMPVLCFTPTPHRSVN